MSHAEAQRTRRVTRGSAQAPLIEPGRKNCIFCGVLKKKVRGSSTKQGTSQLLTEEAEIRLKNAAAIREDDRILIAVGSGDLIAREVHYHKQCYNEYTRELSLSRVAQKASDNAAACADSGPTASDDEAELHGQNRFISDVRNMLFEDSCVLSLTDIAGKYNTMLGTDARNDKVKKLLVQEFGDSIVFARRSVKKKSDVIYAQARVQDIIVRGYDDILESDSDDDADDHVFEELEDSSSKAHDILLQQDTLRILYHAARLLRVAASDHVRMHANLPAEPSSMLPQHGEACIPPMLFNFMPWLLSDTHDNLISAQRIQVNDSALRRRIFLPGPRHPLPIDHCSSPKACRPWFGAPPPVSFRETHHHSQSVWALHRLFAGLGERNMDGRKES